MIDLQHELKNMYFKHRSIQAFENVSAGKNETEKFDGLLYITKN